MLAFFKTFFLHPCSSWRRLKLNYLRKNTHRNVGIISITPYTIIDVAKNAEIDINGYCTLGFKKYHGSKLETSLWMDEGAQLEVQNSCIYHGCDIQIFKDAALIIGKRVTMNRGAQIVCQEKISIGDGCLISRDVVIRDNDGGHTIKADNYKKTSPVIIGNHVWIGQGALILKGSIIGDGSIIGAGAIISGKVKPRSLIMADPARVFAKDIEWDA